MMPRLTHTALTLIAMSALASLPSCTGGLPPQIIGLSDQVAQVGTELKIVLSGTDPDGGNLSYSYRADVPDLAGNADLTRSPDGAGLFRWTPLAADVGQWYFDFTVSDGSHATTVTIQIDVKSAIGSATAPVFRKPLGTGTTIDLAQTQCVNLDVVVEDQDTPEVVIGQEEPVIEGATLMATSGQAATWTWCPSAAQAVADGRYTLTLSADDGANPKTLKTYLLVLRGNTRPDCPGTAPVITHTATNQTTILDLAITAQISDDKGLKQPPLFYYSTTPPASPPDLGAMTQLATTLTSGDMKSGAWTATVPNPVATQPSGQSATVYYLFVADDDDDPMGACDHATTSSTYQLKVTSNGSANLPACAPCSADPQCGAGDECVRIGAGAQGYCLQACGSGCPSGYTCSTAPITSVGGASARQCVPQAGTCGGAQTTCVDDAYEENDTRIQASTQPPLAPNTYQMTSCPSATGSFSDDDWYKLNLTTSSRVDVMLAGGPETDLDLHLYKSDGTLLSSSTSLDPSEEIIKCLPAATYYVKVNAYGHAKNDYYLDYARTSQVCPTCVDDASEDDDTRSQARAAFVQPYSSMNDQLCPGDDDWYQVLLFNGDKLTVDLTFTQLDSTGDLDLHFYDSRGVDLTPCDVVDPSQCSVANGQGATSNEHTVQTITTGCAGGCDYFVVVRGYAGGTNKYSISMHK